MLLFARVLAVLILAAVVPARAADPAALTGTWGGKWDDTWPVFLIVSPGDHPGEVKVVYRWFENTGDPYLMREDTIGHPVGSHIEAGMLTFRIDGDTGLLYGAFSRPRMANLVRIPADATAKLAHVHVEDFGWKPGAIPAAEALDRIKAGDR